jgi:hypothetical protein
MLRITIHENLTSVTFQLEGGLAGSWVQELERCWRGTVPTNFAPLVRFDLSEVTFMDATGKEFLEARHAQGAELVASGCLMRAIVAEISGRSNPDRAFNTAQNGAHTKRGA